MNNQYPYPYNNSGYTCANPLNMTLPGSSLTPEQAEKLRKNQDKFEIEVSDVDVLRTKCNHRTNNGMSALFPATQDGYMTCSVCGSTFKIVDLDPNFVKETIDNMNNLIHTTKTLWIDAPSETNQTLWQFQALLPQFNKICEHAINNFAKYENIGFNNGAPQQNSPAYSAYYTMQNFMNNPMAAQQYGYYPQQYPQQQYAAPMQQAPMMGNPVGYGDPNAQPIAMQQGYPNPMQQQNFQPMMQQQAPQNVQPMQQGYPNPMQQQNFQPMMQQQAPAAGVMPQSNTPAPEAAPVEEVQQSKTYQV